MSALTPWSGSVVRAVAVLFAFSLAACAGRPPLVVAGGDDQPWNESASSAGEVPASLAPRGGFAGAAESAADAQQRSGSGSRRRSRANGSTAVQALIGASRYNDLKSTNDVPGGGGEIVADVSQLPSIGLAGQYKLGGDAVEFGLDGGLLYSWAADRESVYVGNGNTVVFVDQRLSLTDLFFGVYGSADLGGKARVYAAAGPCMLWGYSEYEDNLNSDSGSAFGVGGYGRGGIEFRMPTGALLGFGGRYQVTDLDFGSQVGTYDVDGWQVFLTYTVGM